MNFVPFDYIIYYVLECLLKYEINNEISVNTLFDYKERLLERISYLYEDGELWLRYDDFELLNNHLCFEEVNNQKKLKEFIIKNFDICYLEDNILKLRKNVNIRKLQERRANLKIESKTILSWINGIGDDLELLDMLGESKLKNRVLGYLENEIKLQKEYEKLDCKNDIGLNNFQLDFLQFFSYTYINKIANLENVDFESFIRFLSKMYKESKNEKLNLIEIESAGESVFSDEFYYAKTREIFEMDVFLNAIFSDNSLSYSKTDYRVAKIAYSKEDEDDFLHVFDPFDDEEDDEYDCTEDCLDDIDDEYNDEEDEEQHEYDPEKIHQSEFSFFLKYIDAINKYQEKNGIDEKLSNAKNRLLYVLDNSVYKLYIKQNLDNILNSVMELDLNYEEDIWDYSRCAKAFFVDVFESSEQNEFTIRKLLFISTYYQLTKSPEIKDELMFYKEHPFYEEYSNIILGETKEKRKIK